MNPLDKEFVVWQVRRRLMVMLALFLVVLLLLLLRTWYLQVLRHDRYSTLAENNRLRTVMEKPERGELYDRRGRLLVTNLPSYDLALVLDDVRHLTDTVNSLGVLLKVDPEPMLKSARRQRRTVPYLPVTIHEDLSLKQVAAVEWAHLPGVVVQGAAKRHYVYGSSAGHLIGYVGEVTESQLSNPDFKGVLPGTRVGQYGAEASFDTALRGVPGKRRIEVDAKGFEVRAVSRQRPVNGSEVYLSIDIDVQRAAEKALGDRSGSVVAIDPRNGRIIALVSTPSLNPEEMAQGVSQARWNEIISDPLKPLINRAIQGVYPPGSIFKIPVAVAILEEFGNPKRFFCNGSYPFGGRKYRDWKKGGHGHVTLHDSIVQSCDVFFYEYGHRLEIDTIADYAGRFGFGKLSGIDLPGERAGLLPSRAWKKAARGQVWYPGETLSAAIGQGFVSTTPLQVVAFMAAVGAHGKRFIPSVRMGEWQANEDHFVLAPPQAQEAVALKERTYNTINRALKGVVNEARGTGRAARTKETVIAGKTGTAQVVSLAQDEENRPKHQDVARKLRDHAWFAGYAPADNPRIAVVALVEHGGHGGGVSGPVVRKVVEAFMKTPSANWDDAESAAHLTDLHRQREQR